MSKLRGKNSDPKLVSAFETQDQGCKENQHPWFSFRYMTSNGKHSAKSIDALHAREKSQTLSSLIHRFEELSSRPWTYWLQMGKAIGFETLDYGSLTFSAAPTAKISDDTAVYIFRFDTYRGNGKGRIIGFKESRCPVLHVIGYDIDFSAYNHG